MWVGLAEKQISADGKLGRLTECPELLKHSVGYSRFTGALLQHDFSLWAPAKDVRLAESTRSAACEYSVTQNTGLEKESQGQQHCRVPRYSQAPSGSPW